MDLKRGLTFITRDPEWIVKVLIGTIISIIPIVNFTAIGYALDVTRNVHNERETPLPEWSEFGSQFVRGLLAVIIQLIWSLPLLVLSCPLMIPVISAANSESGEISGGAAALALCLSTLIIVVSVLLIPLTMAATTRFAITNQFSEAMPGPVIREVRSNWKPWYLILAATIGVGLVVAAFSICTFGFGSILFIPLSFYMQLVVAHWYAQAHRQSLGGGVAIPPSMV